jgi:hypothetical protein
MVISTRRKQAKDILIRIFKEVVGLEDNSNLYRACENDGITTMEDLLCLNGAVEIDDLKYFDGTNKVKINKYNQAAIHALQHLWYNRILTLDPIARDWSNLSREQFENYRTSPEFQAIFPHVPEPTPIIVPIRPAMITPTEHATENGEQCENWGALGVFEAFNVEEFENAMLHASESLGCIEEEEDTTTTKDGPTKVLDNTIIFFECFCLIDDFNLHSLDELNVPSEESKHSIPSSTKSSPTNKEAHEPSAMEDTIHIEYPDRTKFVSSMNHEQYQELKLYNDNDWRLSNRAIT